MNIKNLEDYDEQVEQAKQAKPLKARKDLEWNKFIEEFNKLITEQELEQLDDCKSDDCKSDDCKSDDNSTHLIDDTETNVTPDVMDDTETNVSHDVMDIIDIIDKDCHLILNQDNNLNDLSAALKELDYAIEEFNKACEFETEDIVEMIDAEIKSYNNINDENVEKDKYIMNKEDHPLFATVWKFANESINSVHLDFSNISKKITKEPTKLEYKKLGGNTDLDKFKEQQKDFILSIVDDLDKHIIEAIDSYDEDIIIDSAHNEKVKTISKFYSLKEIYNHIKK